MYYIGVTVENIENLKKEGKTRQNEDDHLNFHLHNTLFHLFTLYKKSKNYIPPIYFVPGYKYNIFQNL